MTFAGGRQAVRLSSIGTAYRSKEPTLFEARDGAVECAGAQLDVRKRMDICHHGVSMLVAFGQACEYEKRRIGHVLRAT
jgi:hypothetical protein